MIPVDVIATFNPLGEIKPLYIRLEDTKGILNTYKIIQTLDKKDEKFAGIHSLQFRCVTEISQELQIRYYLESHKWVLLD